VGVLVDLAGVPLTRIERRFPGSRRRTVTPPSLTTVTGLLTELLAEAEERGLDCVRVGVSVPGVVSEPDGTVGAVLELGWPEMPLRAALEQHTALPITIENDANALVFGEYRRGAAAWSTSAVAVLPDKGMGAGIISRGELHRGRHSEAGEIGYLLMERSSLRRSYRDLGDLEDRVGSVAIARAAASRGLAIPDCKPATAREISRLAAAGDPIAAEMRDEILDMVSMAIAALAVILDPDVIVVGGGVGDDLNETIAEIERRLTGRILRVPTLAASALGDDGVLLGVAELALAEVGLPSVEAK
jgi:predicted NBD/HSP70 family sugar kinase